MFYFSNYIYIIYSDSSFPFLDFLSGECLAKRTLSCCGLNSGCNVFCDPKPAVHAMYSGMGGIDLQKSKTNVYSSLTFTEKQSRFRRGTS